jgi:glycosyltransferase involved in cell wall biosynthesis
MNIGRNYFPGSEGKKILLVSHELSITGAPLLLVATAVALNKAGAQVALTWLGHRDVRFPLPKGNNFQIIPLKQSFTVASEADLVIANTAVCKGWVRDLLTQNPRASTKIIWWIHEIDVNRYSENMSCISDVAAVVFDSISSSRQWMSSGYRMPDIVKVIHPCVHDDFLVGAERLRNSSATKFSLRHPFHRQETRESIRRQLGVGREDFLVSLFGTYCDYKGQDLLVDTMAHLLRESSSRRLKLLLIGFATERSRLKFLAKLSADQRKVIGLRRALKRVMDLKPYYLASDVFVLNTQHPGETFGRVTIEAMALRLPILGTNAGGTQEIVKEGVTGLLHPLGKQGQTTLARNINLLLTQPAMATAMGEAGCKRVCELFREDRFYKELAQIVEPIML